MWARILTYTHSLTHSLNQAQKDSIVACAYEAVSYKKEARNSISQQAKGRKEFMESQNIRISTETWRHLEICSLIVSRGVLLTYSIPGNLASLILLYDFVASFDSVKTMSLLISIKSTAQIVAKLAHLKKITRQSTDKESN